jgi:hypothetical protein
MAMMWRGNCSAPRLVFVYFSIFGTIHRLFMNHFVAKAVGVKIWHPRAFDFARAWMATMAQPLLTSQMKLHRRNQ